MGSAFSRVLASHDAASKDYDDDDDGDEVLTSSTPRALATRLVHCDAPVTGDLAPVQTSTHNDKRGKMNKERKKERKKGSKKERKEERKEEDGTIIAQLVVPLHFRFCIVSSLSPRSYNCYFPYFVFI